MKSLFELFAESEALDQLLFSAAEKRTLPPGDEWTVAELKIEDKVVTVEYPTGLFSREDLAYYQLQVVRELARKAQMVMDGEDPNDYPKPVFQR